MLNKLLKKRAYLIGAALAAMVLLYMGGGLRSASGGEWKTDWNNRSIDLNKLLTGGPSKDGIPSIDKPAFVSPARAGDWLKDREPVISLSLNGDARAYPLQIIIWHELVNDVVGGEPVLVSF